MNERKLRIKKPKSERIPEQFQATIYSKLREEIETLTDKQQQENNFEGKSWGGTKFTWTTQTGRFLMSFAII